MRRQRLDGKVVLITGAARGIGEQSARLAAARGAAERLGGIDVVVANAGVANNGTVAITPTEVVARTIEVNLLGVVQTVGATLSHVTERRGYVLLVSSAAAFTVLPGMAAYCASKAGVEQFGNALRLELAHKGVAVGTLHPSWIDTDMVRDQRQESVAFRETLASLPWPLNEITSVQECAEAVIDGIERRRRKVYVPRTVGLVAALRSVFTGPVGELIVRRRAKTMVPQLEAEVRALGRYWGATSVGMGSPRDVAAMPARREP